MAKSHQIGRRVALTSMIIGVVLSTSKILIGMLAHSTSVVADGVESGADVLASGIVMFGLMVAAKPADEDHPYGHGRFETLTGLGLGLLLALTGLAICYRSFSRINEPQQVPAWYAVLPLAASIVVKSILSRVKFRYGNRFRSGALLADAWNDSVDVLSGATALVAVGLTIFDPVRFDKADHYGGVAVGVIVIFLGLRVIRDTSMQLMDTMPDEETMARIRAVAETVPGALVVEKCYARKTGLQYHVDLHLEVDPNMTVKESHDIATEVRIRIKETLDWVADVLVHVEPHSGSSTETAVPHSVQQRP